jgi:hypothetical protein
MPTKNLNRRVSELELATGINEREADKMTSVEVRETNEAILCVEQGVSIPKQNKWFGKDKLIRKINSELEAAY